jgi:TDG/mug DNA glycosylase family protein
MILPDYLVPGLDAVFCGTAAGNTSAAGGHYFANAGNTFWDVLRATGLTRQLLTSERDHEITAHGLGLTDLVKLYAGVDSTLRKEMYDIAGFERWTARAEDRRNAAPCSAIDVRVCPASLG